MANTFTFDNTLSTALARVRLKSGDFLSTDPILYDESINALLTANSDDENATALEVVRAALLKFAREADTRSVVSMSVGFNTRYQGFKDALTRLEAAQGGPTMAEEFVAGSSYAARETFELDTDFVPWSFG